MSSAPSTYNRAKAGWHHCCPPLLQGTMGTSRAVAVYYRPWQLNWNGPLSLSCRRVGEVQGVGGLWANSCRQMWLSFLQLYRLLPHEPPLPQIYASIPTTLAPSGGLNFYTPSWAPLRAMGPGHSGPLLPPVTTPLETSSNILLDVTITGISAWMHTYRWLIFF